MKDDTFGAVIDRRSQAFDRMGRAPTITRGVDRGLGRPPWSRPVGTWEGTSCKGGGNPDSTATNDRLHDPPMKDVDDPGRARETRNTPTIMDATVGYKDSP